MASPADRIWKVKQLSGSAAELHAVDLAWERSVVLMNVSRPALVLGSTQARDEVNLVRATTEGFDVVRRRSGGGLVVLDEHAVWIDVVISRDDPLYIDDVSHSMQWLGEAWSSALASFGVVAEMHTGAMIQREMGRHVCFAGLAPGELLVGGAKLLGISQRRGRDGARFQCVVYRQWAPQSWLTSLDEPRTGGQVVDLIGSLKVATVSASGPDLLDALAQSLAQKGFPGM